MNPVPQTAEELRLAHRMMGPFQIVVIENETVSASLRLLLEYFGHRVETASDGRSGTELVKAIKPDIVFTRIELPDTDGYSVAKEIRTTFPKKPVLVAHTGYGKWEIGDRAKIAGFDILITKPASPVDLLDAFSFVTGKSIREELKL